MRGKIILKNKISKKSGLSDLKVLCIGEVLWDLLPTGAKAGGAPMNVAMHMRKFGIDAHFAGRIGNDALGNELKDFILKNGLSDSLIQTDYERLTSTVVVELMENNQVKFEIVDNVAWDGFEATEDLKRAAIQSDVIVYGTLASRHALARENIISILGNGSINLIDVNLRPPFNSREVVETLLRKAGIAKLNDDELKAIGAWHEKKPVEKDLARWFTDEYQCEMVCITRGERGAIIYDGKDFFEHPGYKVKVVDTVGSGDAFLAGFLANFLTGKSIDQALDFACATGALVATKAGATPEYKIEDINYIINNSKKTIA